MAGIVKFYETIIELVGGALLINGSTGDYGTPANGMFWYNQTSGKMRVYESGAWQNVVDAAGGAGTAVVVTVWNSSGSSLAKGEIVYVTGWDVTNSMPTVDVAQANNIATSYVLGVVLATFNNGASGTVCVYGNALSMTNAGFTDSAEIYLSQSVAGDYTETKPTSGIIVPIGLIRRSAGSSGGSLFIRPERPYTEPMTGFDLAADTGTPETVEDGETLTISGGTGISTVVGATNEVTISVDESAIDHGGLAGLADDDHTQYALLAGRSGGQVLKGGTGSGDDLTLESTNNATKGTVFIGPTIGDNRVTINGTDVALVIGGTTVPGILTAADESSGTVGLFNAHKHTDTASSSANIILARSRGSEASETVVADDDVVGQIRFAAYDGTDYAQTAQIASDVDGTPGSNDMPGRLRFLTTPDGSQTLAEAMRIDSAQNVGIGEDAPLTKLHVSDGGALGGGFALGSGTNLLVHNSSAAGDEAAIQITCGTSGEATLYFGPSDAAPPAYIQYDSAGDLTILSSAGNVLLYAASGQINLISPGTQVGNTSAPNHLLDVDGSFGGKVNSLTGATTLDATHFIIFASVSGGGFTITLPVASTCPGRIYFIKRTDASANTLTIARSGSDTVDGATSITIAANTGYIFSNNGTNWFSMSRL